MHPSSWLDVDGDDGVAELLWEDAERRFYKIRRGNADGSNSRRLAVLPATDHPTPASLNRLAHEHELKDRLDSTWAVRPLELVREHGTTMLVLEHHDGKPLDHLITRPMDVDAFLRIGVAVAAAMVRLHERGIVHKDIKPANILVDPAGDHVWLMGFGVASLLPRERLSPEPPELIAGTLAYMAPEQTGRMNRSIDARSDMYSLGVTFYEMLTGALPFTAADPMEWVHCHIARRPVPPGARVEDVPPQLSAIIMKLLAKTPEERYQTAAGVERDLRRCLTSWESSARVDDFPPGEHDTPDRLRIPERLYGREREIETLIAAFDRVVTDGTPCLVLVSGHPGIGKSSVVNELHKSLVPPRGLFAAGKFDQYKRDIPYSTLAQAFQSLVRPLLAKSDVDLSPWRVALGEALGRNGQLMVDLVPELNLIIGEQAPVPELPPQDAQRRFQLVFRRFLSVFAKAEHPLALFVDDLQWLDAATRELLENLLTSDDVRHVLFVGAYRDNEVNSAHPLTRTLDEIRKAGASIQEIQLAPLGRESVGQLIADSLHCTRERAGELSPLVHEKTGGNPFFTNQFLTALADEALITFDHDTAGWSWDLARIHAKGFTENVVELMVGRLGRLPARTQRVLRQLACLGNSADFARLVVVHEGSEEALRRDLRDALRTEFVLCTDGSYRFLHDRVQEAAYSLIPEKERAAAHLRIGRLLVANTPAERREEAIFEIVNQLNRGLELMVARDEKDQLAELNLIAGKRAKASTAYVSALKYLVAGTALLSDDGWKRRPDLMFALELNRAECELLTGELSAADERLTMLVSRASDSTEQARIACLRIDLNMMMDRNDRALDVCLAYMHYLGIVWSPQPTENEARWEYDRTWALFGGDIERLIDLPLMRDPAIVATLDVLTTAVTPALYTNENLLCLIVCQIINLSLEHGNTDGSCLAYVWLGRIAGYRFGNYQACFRFGQLGYDLVERSGMDRFKARTYITFGNYCVPWFKHVRAAREMLRRAFDAANRNGDLPYAAFSYNNLVANLFAAGDSLVDVQREAEGGLAFAHTARFSAVVDLLTTQLGLIRTLRGLTPTFGCFSDAQFDERQYERSLSSGAAPGVPIAACRYWIRKLQARFLASDPVAALHASSNVQRMLWTTPTALEVADYHLYGALSHAASCDARNPVQYHLHLEAAAAHHRQLMEWAENCPENFQHRAALVGAEIARIEARELDAERQYEEAIKVARENDFVHIEALANELAAGFYARRGFEKIARAYLRDARDGYRQWGADGKVRQLEKRHPHLREDDARVDPTRTVETSAEQLDLAVVLQVLGAVSRETDLEKLIATVMRLALEHAGAERGLLVLPRGDQYLLEATAGIGEAGVTVALVQTQVTSADLPESIFQYVLRTRETVLLHDAREGAFSDDPYLRQHRVRSLLCMPLLDQSRIIGVLYFENRLASEVFTPSRMALLKLLASEAAISIENARLYRDLHEREARVRRLIDANIIGMFIWHADGRVFEANGEFLRIIGYSRGDLVSGDLRWTAFTLPESRDRDLRMLEDHKNGGAAKSEERELLRKDGTRVPVLTGGTMFEGVSDEGVAFVIDLTERRRAEQDLRERERESRVILDTIPGLVAVLTPSGEVDAANRELLMFCGLPLEAMKDWGANGIVHPDDLSRIAPIFTRAIASGEPYESEERVRRFDGVYRWVQSRGLPLRDSKGRIVRWYVVLADIDDRKRAEDRLDEARSELSRVARIMAMGALTASIAHEVNQPLTGIITNAGTCLRMLDASPPNVDGARETARRTIRDGQRAADVIGQLRGMFSKREFTLESIDVNEAIREVVALSLSDLQRARVAVQIELAERLPSIMGDRIQLQQVIVNLLRNASEAMADIDDRPRELIVRTEPQGDTGVRVIVRDAGVGLDGQSLHKLFDAFYTTKEGGMGIGLSISRSIIERHHGRMWAEANDGPGATFAFSIPVGA